MHRHRLPLSIPMSSAIDPLWHYATAPSISPYPTHSFFGKILSPRLGKKHILASLGAAARTWVKPQTSCSQCHHPPGRLTPKTFVMLIHDLPVVPSAVKIADKAPDSAAASQPPRQQPRSNLKADICPKLSVYLTLRAVVPLS